MQGDKIYTTYDVLEIFPVVGLEFFISASKVLEIGFCELKGYFVRLLRFCHGCCLVKTILTSDMAKTMGRMWELAKCAGRKRAACGTRLISNPTTQLPYPYKTDSPPEDNDSMQGKL